MEVWRATNKYHHPVNGQHGCPIASITGRLGGKKQVNQTFMDTSMLHTKQLFPKLYKMYKINKNKTNTHKKLKSL